MEESKRSEHAPPFTSVSQIATWEGTTMSEHGEGPEVLLTPGEVAALFRVDPKTVTRWSNAGKLPSIRTLGGHRRYRQAEVLALLDQRGTVPTDSGALREHL
jgi:excisionase family DNA binding protein